MMNFAHDDLDGEALSATWCEECHATVTAPHNCPWQETECARQSCGVMIPEWEGVVVEDPWGRPWETFCSEDCRDAEMERREARALEEWHGGGGPHVPTEEDWAEWLRVKR